MPRGHTGVCEAGTRQQGSSAKASPLVPAWLAALEESEHRANSAQHPLALYFTPAPRSLPPGPLGRLPPEGSLPEHAVQLHFGADVQGIRICLVHGRRRGHGAGF